MIMRYKNIVLKSNEKTEIFTLYLNVAGMLQQHAVLQKFI